MDTMTCRADWTGRVIDGKFSLIRWLGDSRQSSVYLTERPEPGARKAAIKLMPADAMGAKAHMEAWTAARALFHPNLLRLYRAGRFEMDGIPMLYVVTELAEENLSLVLAERPITPAEATDTLGQVIEALAYLHAKGFVHGHLKPSNIMGVEDRLRLSTDSLHLPGQMGRHFPAPGIYDAPETATDPLAPTADIWSLGVILVEAFTQKPPVWAGSVLPERTQASLGQSVPEPFLHIARLCLQANPRRRATIAEIREILNPPRPPLGVLSGAQPAEYERQRRIPVFAIVAALVIALAVAGTYFFLRANKPELWTRAQQSIANPGLSPAPTPKPSAATVAGPGRQSPPAESPARSAANPGGGSGAVGDTAAAQAAPGAVVKGAVAVRALPSISPSAAKTIQGQFESSIRVDVGPDGSVSAATVSARGPSRYFANLALQAARRWRFRPAQSGGRPVASEWLLRFQFSRRSTEVSASEVAP